MYTRVATRHRLPTATVPVPSLLTDSRCEEISAADDNLIYICLPELQVLNRLGDTAWRTGSAFLGRGPERSCCRSDQKFRAHEHFAWAASV